MPSLDWIGKKTVLNHHKEVPFHLLRCDPDLSVGELDSGKSAGAGRNLFVRHADGVELCGGQKGVCRAINHLYALCRCFKSTTATSTLSASIR